MNWFRRRPRTRLGDADRRIRMVRSSRAVYVEEDRSEIDIQLLMEDGEIITLVLPPRLAGKLVAEVSQAYEAINPPLARGFGAATWQGME